MVEGDLLSNGKHPTEGTTLIAENNLQNADHRLLIRTTSTLGADCSELSKKLGCKIETIVGDILSVGYKSVKALANGNDRVIVSLKDGKIDVESFKDKQE
jgi:hypothetical protein